MTKHWPVARLQKPPGQSASLVHPPTTAPPPPPPPVSTTHVLLTQTNGAVQAGPAQHSCPSRPQARHFVGFSRPLQTRPPQHFSAPPSQFCPSPRHCPTCARTVRRWRRTRAFASVSLEPSAAPVRAA